MRNPERASQTALTAAAARAAHLLVDRDPPLFADPLATALLGEHAEELLAYHHAHGTHPVLAGARAQVTVRSRYTEEQVAAAVRRGITQYVILGAGLDTFAYRSPLADRIRVFEVDHPATQAEKRQRLADAGIAVPPGVVFVPVDFESDSLADRLAGHGYQPTRPAIVGWLGVTVYLTRAAIEDTLAALGGLAPGTEIVFDYLLPAALRDEAGQAYAEALMPVSAERGEPWLTFLSPDDTTALLDRHGFELVRHVRQRDAVDAADWRRSDSLRPAELSILAHARRRDRP